jgi:hypothetical protein
VLIGLLEAANITSIAGDKGQDPYMCQSTPDGSNVLSVAFSASTLVMVGFSSLHFRLMLWPYDVCSPSYGMFYRIWINNSHVATIDTRFCFNNHDGVILTTFATGCGLGEQQRHTLATRCMLKLLVPGHEALVDLVSG